MIVVEQRDEAVLFDRAAAVVRRAIEGRCAEGGACFLGVVGGKSLMALFARLARDPRPFGGRVEVFWLDERVAPGQKNADEILPMLATMREAGIDLRWHPLDGGDRETILRQADQALALLRRGGTAFDVVVCSSGDDGHIASLFPNAPTLSMSEAGYVLVEDAPKPPPERVTVTPPLLTSATSALLFFTGGKKEAWSRFSSPDVSLSDCPAKILLAVDDLTVFTSIV